MSEMINIPGRLHAITSENVVAGSDEILDDTTGKKQNVINIEVSNKLGSLETELASKQKTLTAGVGITIAPDGIISTIADGSIGKIVEDHTAISSPIEGLLYLEQTEIQGTYAQYVYNGDTWVSLGNIVLSFGLDLDDVPTAGSNNVVKSGGIYETIKTDFNKIAKFIPEEDITDASTKTLLFNEESEYTAGLLESNGSITSGYGGHTSDFISVEFGDIIMTRGAYNFDTQRPTILGYDANKQNPIIIAQGKSNYREYLYSDITGYWYFISYNIKYVRLSSNKTPFEFCKVSLFDAFNDKMEVKNYLKGYYDQFRGITNSQFMRGRVVKNGSEYIEVYKGMTIFATFTGFASARGIALYDSAKEFIKSLEISYNSRPDNSNVGIFFYTFTEEDIDSGIKYLKCESQILDSNGINEYLVNSSFFYILDDNIEHYTNMFPVLFKTQFFQTSLIRQPSNDLSKVITTVSSGTVTKTSETEITISSTRAIVEFKMNDRRRIYNGFKEISLIHLKISDISGSFRMTKYNIPSLVYAEDLSEDSDIYILQYDNQYNIIDISVEAGELPSAKIEVKEFLSVHVKSDIFNNSIIASIKKTSGAANIKYTYEGFFFSNVKNFIDAYKTDNVGMNTQIALYAEQSKTCYDLQTHQLIRKRHYVSFGTSITSGTCGGYAPYIAKKFDLTLTNLGVSGSVPHGPNGSLRDERLALIPLDSVLCTICYGANAWAHSDDINSRDTANSVGAINHAIDYIQEHIPECVIVLGVDCGGPNSTQCIDIKAIAENRHVFYAPTDYIDGPLIYNPETGVSTWRRTIGLTSYDGVHLNVLGNLRMASAFINTIANILPPKGVY